MNAFVVDASVWVARLVAQDEFHLFVKNWMFKQNQIGSQFISPSLLLTEVSGAVSQRTNRPELAHKAIRDIQKLTGVHIIEMNHKLILEAADLAAESGLRGADSVYMAVAKKLNIPLVTLDVEQRKRSSKSILIYNIENG